MYDWQARTSVPHQKVIVKSKLDDRVILETESDENGIVRFTVPYPFEPCYLVFVKPANEPTWETVIETPDTQKEGGT